MNKFQAESVVDRLLKSSVRHDLSVATGRPVTDETILGALLEMAVALTNGDGQARPLLLRAFALQREREQSGQAYRERKAAKAPQPKQPEPAPEPPKAEPPVKWGDHWGGGRSREPKFWLHMTEESKRLYAAQQVSRDEFRAALPVKEVARRLGYGEFQIYDRVSPIKSTGSLLADLAVRYGVLVGFREEDLPHIDRRMKADGLEPVRGGS